MYLCVCYSGSVVYAPSIMSSTNMMVLRSIYGRVACTVVLFTYLVFVCVCCYSSGSVMYRAPSVVLRVKIVEE